MSTLGFKYETYPSTTHRQVSGPFHTTGLCVPALPIMDSFLICIVFSSNLELFSVPFQFYQSLEQRTLWFISLTHAVNIEKNTIVETNHVAVFADS